MRTLKFRAWDRIERKMWAPIIKPDGRLMAPNCFGGYVTFDDPQDPLMQFTGLKDKSGVEIYELCELDGHYRVLWESGRYVLQHISSGDIVGPLQSDALPANEREITREYAPI